MSERRKQIFRVTPTQALICLAWTCAWLAVTREFFVLSEAAREARNQHDTLPLIACLASWFGSGAALGAAIGTITGHALLWSIVGIFTWAAVLRWLAT